MFKTDHWLIYALGSAFFAGLTVILGKIGVQGINSNVATFVRTCVILVFIGAIVSFRREWFGDTWSSKSVVYLVLSGLATGLSWLCYYRALQLGDASKVAPVDKLGVVFAILLALVFLGEKLTWQVGLGGSLVAAGAVVMALA